MNEIKQDNDNALRLSEGLGPFKYATGFMGGTAPGQKVTRHNVHYLPPRSVVDIGDGSRLIHLHGDVWLWINNGMWIYDSIGNLAARLDDESFAGHVSPNAELTGVAKRSPS